MGSMVSGELYRQDEYDKLLPAIREGLQLVELTPEESANLEGMNRKQRRDWMRANKKFSRRKRDVKTTQAS